MKHPSPQDRRAGFTLIEVMIAVAAAGIVLAGSYRAVFEIHRLAQSEAALQRAMQCMESQSEILRAAPFADIAPGGPQTFDLSITSLAGLPLGRGEFTVEQPGVSSLKRIRVAVSWEDPRTGPRSIHTVILRTQERRAP